jgi:hypothetical protein
MSLINDALKRAKAAQQAAPPPLDPPPLRPAEPDTDLALRHGLGYSVPLALAAISLLVVFFGWRLSRQTNDGRPEQAGPDRLPMTATPAVVKESEPTAAMPVRARTPEPGSSNAPSPQSTPVTTALPIAPANGSGQPHESPSLAHDSHASPATATATNTTAAVAAAPIAQPPPLKLQGVIFNPGRPSAVISGRTLFVGDRLGNMRVAAIGRDSATLIGGGKTNVLTLEQ